MPHHLGLLGRSWETMSAAPGPVPRCTRNGNAYSDCSAGFSRREGFLLLPAPFSSLVAQIPCLLHYTLLHSPFHETAGRWGWTGFLALELQLLTPPLLPAAASLLEKPVSNAFPPRWQRGP